MFRGATLVNLDSKGRLSVPTRYREQLLEKRCRSNGLHH
ncbi:cell division protein MraZ [Escherichia coli]|uniref:Cell division protein MraZ n=1 Tax=Escherichia coli TaxID=562 RepID=A0A376MRH3_ECOLX|nr:cell division protein MraZ [Escherichia coli]